MENLREQSTTVAFPSSELKAWYAGLGIEAKLAAAMIVPLAVDGIGNTPDYGKTGMEIVRELQEEIAEAEQLPENLEAFREVYQQINGDS